MQLYCLSEKNSIYNLCYHGCYEKVLALEEMTGNFGNNMTVIDEIQSEEKSRPRYYPNEAPNWNVGLWGACSGGYMKIVKLMIKRGATVFAGGFYDACASGYTEIVQLLLEKRIYYLDRGLYGACFGGHMDIVTMLIENGANDWDDGITGACEGRHIEIIDYLVIHIMIFVDKLPKGSCIIYGCACHRYDCLFSKR